MVTEIGHNIMNSEERQARLLTKLIHSLYINKGKIDIWVSEQMVPNL